jgi:hypothetical protein
LFLLDELYAALVNVRQGIADDSEVTDRVLYHRAPTLTRNRARRGITLVFAIIILMALSGFVSLGVDWGHVQLTKTELIQATESAARAPPASWAAPLPTCKTPPSPGRG